MFSFHLLPCLNPLLASFLILAILAQSSFQTASILGKNSQSSTQLKTPYLPETKFSYNEYAEYSDSEDREKGPQPPQWSQLPSREAVQSQSTIAPVLLSAELDPSITWDSKWPPEGTVGQFGQLSAVSIDPEGNVALFHRGSRTWGTGTFDIHNKFDREEGPIRENTVVLLNAAGERIGEWGRSVFYLPHGLTIDHLGNYWITDVAMHQVFKFNAKEILEELKTGGKDLAAPTAAKPALVLGEAFEPGNDNKRFCKPTAVAVQKNGDFFVSDGYCNSRIIKFNQKGERILTWGRSWELNENLFARPPPMNAFFVPHALALAEESEYIFVADRENGRVLCFHSNNGTFHKQYKHPVIGSRIFSIAYAREKIYLVNGPEIGLRGVRVRGFVIDAKTGSLQSQFAPPEDLNNPHDIAVTLDGKSIYVVQLDPHKVHKFTQEINSTLSAIQTHNKPAFAVAAKGVRPSSQSPLTHDESVPRDVDLVQSINEGGINGGSGITATTIILSLVTAAVVLVALCVAVAAIVARCRKRGCLLLTVRRGMRWESERRENFKLSNLLESRKKKSKGGRKFFDKRPNTKDFSKLNTEPETSDDENNLTKII